MRLLLPLLSCLTIGVHAGAEAQTPPAPASRTASAPRAAAQRSRAAAATSTLTVTVTDGGGLPLQGVGVRVTGPVEREGTTIASGMARFLNLRAGTYRLRFSHDGFVTLERDVVVRAGAPLAIDVMLSAREEGEAPEAETPEPPPAPAANTAPPGDPRTVALVDFIEKNFISGRDPMKKDALGCTASAATTLLQIRDPLPERALPDADEVLYVVAGEGTLRLGNRDVPLEGSTLAIVPRGTVRGITRDGRNPLILLSVVSGPACTQ
jgi:Carboxypeptidase regulatory-like domain